MRSYFGLSNGREVSLFNVVRATSLISAFSVALRALYIFLGTVPGGFAGLVRLWLGDQ